MDRSYDTICDVQEVVGRARSSRSRCAAALPVRLSAKQMTYNLPLTFISISISIYHMQPRHDISAYGCIGLGGNEGEDDIYIQLFISKRPGDQ